LKPLLLLDIDGVLCPFDSASSDHLEPVGDPFGAVYSPAHTPWLQELEGLFDIAWCTAWEHKANEFIVPLHEMEPKPVVPLEDILPLDDGTYKLPEVKKFVKSQPCAWVDDDFRPDAYDWMRKRDKTIPTALFLTHPGSGLDDITMSLLRLFAHSVNERQSHGI
jgi:hypothetical protein